MTMVSDETFMRMAVDLSVQGLGRVAPNPSVGCVIVQFPDRGGPRVVGRGVTGPGGLPHAETQALQQAGASALGATAYVTLEPCCHAGRRSVSCALSLIHAGIARVVVSTLDPNAQVNGRGVALLRSAGIEVVLGLCRAQAEDINAGFFTCMRKSRPLVTLKMATSLDGSIADCCRRWLSGQAARDMVHRMRDTYDAIAVGVGTVLTDDPRLTVRLPGREERSPVRLVVDTHLRTPVVSQLVQTARQYPLWIAASACADPARLSALAQNNVRCLGIEANEDGRVSVPTLLRRLAREGITRLFLEGGSGLATSFVRHGCVDRVAWFVVPRFLGGGALKALGPLRAPGLELRLEKSTRLEDDVLLEYAVL